MSRGRIRFAVVVLTAAAVLATPTSAFAAMDATLSSAHARPGDDVLLLTDDHGGSWQYVGLSEENHQKIYLASTATAYSAGPCGGPGSQAVGRLAWRGNAAGLAFVAPNLPAGDYWLFMQTDGQCWRLAGGTGASTGLLVLAIGNVPADNQEAAARWTVDSLGQPSAPTPRPARVAAPSSPSPLLWLPIGVGAVSLVLLALLLGRSARAGRRVATPSVKL